MSKLINDLDKIAGISVTDIEAKITESLERIKNIGNLNIIKDGSGMNNAQLRLMECIIDEELTNVRKQLPLLASLLIIRDKIK